MTTSAALQVLVLTLLAILVAGQDLTELGNSDVINDHSTNDRGILYLLRNEALPNYVRERITRNGLKREPLMLSDDAQAADTYKRRGKKPQCMRDFWKGRGLIDC